jgi:EmrB/QacA subfamily drug resistance transporter
MANIFKPPCDEAVILAGPEVAPCSPAVGRWVLAATILGSSMAFIDGTIVNVALPILQADLDATSTQTQWVVQSYALFLAALILVGGSLGDRLGRKRVFISGVAVYAAASIWCGLAPDIQQLIIAQAVKGVGGALLVPGSLAIISATFSEAGRGRAIGTWSGFTAITTALGPVLGGWLAETISWRAVFFINLPLAIIVLVLTLWRVPESRDDQAAETPLDWRGAVLVTLGMGSMIYGLTGAARVGLSHPQVLVPVILGALLLLVFIWLEARLAGPMMPLNLFRSRTFSGANLLTLLLYSALGGALYFFPFNLIQVQGYSPTAAGSALLPFTLVMFLLSRWSGGLVERYGARRPLILGSVVVALGFALFAVPGTGGSYWTSFFPAVLGVGLGMALVVAPLTTTVMNSVATHQAGVASGINNAVSRVAGLLGVAVLSILIFSIFDQALTARLGRLDLPAEIQQAMNEQRANLAAARIPPEAGPDLQATLEQAVKEAYVAGFRGVMLAAAGLALASAIIAWAMIEKSTFDEAERITL